MKTLATTALSVALMTHAALFSAPNTEEVDSKNSMNQFQEEPLPEIQITPVPSEIPMSDKDNFFPMIFEGQLEIDTHIFTKKDQVILRDPSGEKIAIVDISDLALNAPIEEFLSVPVFVQGTTEPGSYGTKFIIHATSIQLQ